MQSKLDGFYNDEFLLERNFYDFESAFWSFDSKIDSDDKVIE